MEFNIPIPLQQEHDALHEDLRRATGAGGEVGEAAKALANLMHPHFVKEDQVALPPLGLLARLSRGELEPGMGDVLALTDRLEAELPTMLEEHKAILVALQRLQEVAQRDGHDEVVAFAKQLALHAQTEEQVMYPAAVLVGRYLKQVLRRSSGSGPAS